MRTRKEDYRYFGGFFENPKDIEHGQVWMFYNSTFVKTVIVDSVEEETVTYIGLHNGKTYVSRMNYKQFQYMYDLVIDEIKE